MVVVLTPFTWCAWPVQDQLRGCTCVHAWQLCLPCGGWGGVDVGKDLGVCPLLWMRVRMECVITHAYKLIHYSRTTGYSMPNNRNQKRSK